MAIRLGDKNLIVPTDDDTNLFHLSYDKKGGVNSTILKKEIVWEILVNQKEKDYYLDSPTETTIVFESTSNYKWWLKKLLKCFDDKMCFEISEVIRSEIEKDNISYNYFNANEFPCPDKRDYFIDNCVDPVKNDIEEEDDPTTTCP